MTANQYSMPSFGEGLNFSDAWLDLPPQLMGTATSFGPHTTTSFDTLTGNAYPPNNTLITSSSSSTPPHGASLHDQQLELQRLISSSNLMPPPPQPLQQVLSPLPSHQYLQQHSDDILNAAATLMQNGNSSRSTIAKSCESVQARRLIGFPVGHLRHQPMEEFREESRRGSTYIDHDNTFAEWMWGSKERAPQRKLPSADFQWGSDSSFGHPQGYIQDPIKELSDDKVKSQQKCPGCFEASSAPESRLDSPTSGNRDKGDEASYAKGVDDINAPPRKRRKSKVIKDPAEDEEEEEDDDSPKSGKKRRPKSERTATNGSSSPLEAGTNGRRRKSTTNGAKPPRENLTEEQKRENHIRSEQKRRTVIKEGFDDLGELVPGLKGGGVSKSTTLAMAAVWLEDLLRGNKALSVQMTALESD